MDSTILDAPCCQAFFDGLGWTVESLVEGLDLQVKSLSCMFDACASQRYHPLSPTVLITMFYFQAATSITLLRSEFVLPNQGALLIRLFLRRCYLQGVSVSDSPQ